MWEYGGRGDARIEDSDDVETGLFAKALLQGVSWEEADSSKEDEFKAWQPVCQFDLHGWFRGLDRTYRKYRQSSTRTWNRENSAG